MAKDALDLRDLHHGSLNTLEDSNATGTTGDPRRTNAVASLRRTQADAYARNTIGSRTEYIGIVVASYPIDFPGFTDKAGLLTQYQVGSAATDKESYDMIQRARKTAYKVFIPETDPRPIPGFNSLDDPVTLSLPEAYANIPGLKAPVAPGAAVAVTYNNPNHLGAPLIIRVVNDRLTVGSTNLNNRGCKKWEKALGRKWRDRNKVHTPGTAPYTPDIDMYDYRGKLVPAKEEDCVPKVRKSPKKGILQEEIVTSQIVPNYKGKVGTVQGKKSFIERLERAHKELTDKGHKGFTIGDHGRSYAWQRKAYMTLGQPGQVKWNARHKNSKVAHPCYGYHTEGQAVDINQGENIDDILAHGPVYQALYNAGLRRIDREYWHWSIGERSDHDVDRPESTGHARDKVFGAGVVGSPADTFRPSQGNSNSGAEDFPMPGEEPTSSTMPEQQDDEATFPP